MKIIVLGAGQVGSSVAASLCVEHDVTIVDVNPAPLQQLQDRYDLRTLAGPASHPETIRQAGGKDTELIIAVTSSDEVNMVACQVAAARFNIPKKIARIRSAAYQLEDDLFVLDKKEFGDPADRDPRLRVDVLISPEEEVTNSIQRLIELTGALQVLDFADGRVQLVGVRAAHGSPLVGHEVRDLATHMPSIDTRIVAIYRRGQGIPPDGDTIIEVGDEVFFIAAPEHCRAIMSELCSVDNPGRRVMIAGGGSIGTRLAMSIERSVQTKVIEADPERARVISEQLVKSIVLHGDAADEDLMLEESIDKMDVFCALTNADEANIISGMLAKRLGARTVMALINRAAYVDLVQTDIIDVAISPQVVTIGSVLAHVRRGDVVRVHSLRRGAAEAIEAIAHNETKVVGRAAEDIDLPPGTVLGALVRGDQVIIVHHDTVIEDKDHVILLVTDRRHVRDVEKLFAAPATAWIF
ncbi:MAG: Trk system potassium transporter TrkA [Gammaproteobacteria bacterium]|nr:Trk system potassium transporter TrkA [Gammaproteobacteria bacterium]NNM00798.1 Trk system potassium transporter TrkA [Gammaproteobacteria bacterium]